MKVAVYCVSKSGFDVAMKIRENVYNDCHVYTTSRVYSSLNLEYKNFDYITEVRTRIPEALDITFYKYDVHIFVASTGATVRLISGKFKTKDVDPAVISVDDHANFVVSVLSGHLGGANEECKKIAEGIKAVPVVTTASEVGGKIAVDTLSQQIKGKLHSLETAKRVTSLIVNGEKVSLHLPENIVIAHENSAGAIIISNRKKIEVSKIIPQNIVIGIGCRRGIEKEHIITKLKEVMENQNLELSSIRKAASAWVKSDETGLIEAMEELGIPVTFYEREEIQEVEHLIEEKSEYVKKTIGVYGVSEPCAYLASNRQGQFLVRKIVLDGMTLSIFEEDMEKINNKKD